jgi:hypothetical protein
LYWTNPFSLILMSLSSLKPECFSETPHRTHHSQELLCGGSHFREAFWLQRR